jgi:hypothetical protein
LENLLPGESPEKALKVDLFPPNADLFSPTADAPKAAFQNRKKKRENVVPAIGKLSLSLKVLTLLLALLVQKRKN